MAALDRYAHRLSVAPMMGVTDRHWRHLARLLSKKTLVYTEMVVDNALVHNADILGHTRFLGHASLEHPLAVQLGGNDPSLLKEACALTLEHLKSTCVEVNLNCGCPSNVVAQKHCFGARLMLKPDLVREIVHQLDRVCGPKGIPVSVKHRLGTDLSGSDYATTKRFVESCRQGGCRHFVLHARSAVLAEGFSTNQNRTIPPLDTSVAHKLVRDLPDCTFALNGQLKTLEDCAVHFEDYETLPPVHSCMIGRGAWYDPWKILSTADAFLGYENVCQSRRSVLDAYLDYADAQYPLLDIAEDALYRPLYYLFAGEARAKSFRVGLSAESTRRAKAARRGAPDLPPPSTVVREALAAARITQGALDRKPGEASRNRPESPLTVAVAALDISDSSS